MPACAPRNLDLGHEPGAGLHVLHQDAHILVLDKPSGLLSVPAKPPGPQDCLHARAVAAIPDALLIHRLDMETSGVMVFARSRLAQRHLNWQFERRQVRKTYVARVAGRVEADEGRVELPLIADWPNRPRQMVCFQRGKPAVTDWRVLAREAAVTRLELRPLTGRSHQLRVHCRALGHPILGDPFYADPAALAAAPRLQLHAAALAFRHPDGGAWVEFTAPVPF
jgi:tRNA pseudouridine32 synthase/23S rRNA pseudouridine746 synthase